MVAQFEKVNMERDIADKDPAGNVVSMQITRVFSGIARRLGLGRLTSFEGRRDYGKIFGWDATLTPENMMHMYNRGGIAKRTIDAYPDAIWSRPPVIWADGDDAWTEEWDALIEGVHAWPVMHRLDKLAGLGHYAVLLIGTDRPGLETPLKSAGKITFLQPYGETSVKIERYETDPTSPNFGKPIMYRVYPENPGGSALGSGGSGGYGGPENGASVRSSFRVHASRILHVAKGCLEDEVFGQPDLAPIWDYLTDLRKVVGSSSESYWVAANRGLQADIDKEMSLSDADQAALQDEIEEFYNGFRRFVRTKGVKLNALDNDIADPTAAFGVLVTLIAGARGIPKRILLGSEAGQLASSEDKSNWAERVEEYRALTIEPMFIKPMLKYMVQNGLIRAPIAGSKLKILWPDAYRMSPLERGQTSAQSGRVLSYITKLVESESAVAKTLMTRVEMRSLLGLSTDNRILEDDPQP